MLTRQEVSEAVENGRFYDLEGLEGVETVSTVWHDKSYKSTVLKVLTTENDILYAEFRGNYNSWEGTEWEDAVFVEPFEKTVTDYREITLPDLETEIISEMRKLNYDYFESKTYGKSAPYKNVYRENWGDGNAIVVVFEVPLGNKTVYVKFEGTYSSWEDTIWSDAYFAEPYQHTETKYKRIN